MTDESQQSTGDVGELQADEVITHKEGHEPVDPEPAPELELDELSSRLLGFARALPLDEVEPSPDHPTFEAALLWANENGCIWQHEIQTLHHPAGVYVTAPFVLAVSRLMKHVGTEAV